MTQTIEPSDKGGLYRESRAIEVIENGASDEEIAEVIANLRRLAPEDYPYDLNNEVRNERIH